MNYTILYYITNLKYTVPSIYCVCVQYIYRGRVKIETKNSVLVFQKWPLNTLKSFVSTPGKIIIRMGVFSRHAT